jgi:ABC-2 type transport system ATP-binding protein
MKRHDIMDTEVKNCLLKPIQAEREEGKLEAVTVKNLTKKYGENTVLKGIDLKIEHGEIFGILGANGAGKTTTLECIEGLRRYDSGEISVSGNAPGSAKMRASTGVQLQSASLPPNITAKEAITLYCKWRGIPADIQLLDVFGMEGLYDKQYKTMSAGQKRRLHLSLSCVDSPEIIFLDEPTAGLDVEWRVTLHKEIKKLNEKGVTVVFSSHDMAEIEELCDRIAIIIGGRIAFTGTPYEITAAHNQTSRVSVKTNAGIKGAKFSLSAYKGENEGYELYEMDNLGDGLIELLQYIKQTGDEVIDLRIDHPSLEEKFIEIIKGEKRQ